MSTVDIKILDRAVSVSERAIENLNTRLQRCETSKGYTDAVHKYESSGLTITKAPSSGIGLIDVSDLPSPTKEIKGFRFDDDTDINTIVMAIINRTSKKPHVNFERRDTYLSFPSATMKRVFVDEERPFKDTMSDLVTEEFLKHDNTMKDFLRIFIELMVKSITLYMEKKNIGKNHIMFFYKGGNVVRYVLRQYIYEEIGAVGDIVDEKFGKYFKKSDADFQINIDPKLDNYEKVHEDMQLLSYHILYRVRNIYLSDKHALDFETLKPKFSEIILKKYLAKLQGLNIITNSSSKSSYKDIKFVRLVYNDIEVGEFLPDLPFKEYESQPSSHSDMEPENQAQKSETCKRSGSKRADIAIVNHPNGQELCIYKMKYLHRRGLDTLIDGKITKENFANNDRDEMYISWNNSLEFNNTVEQDKLIKFSLVRSKLNFKAFYITADGANLDCMNIGGEFIDISIPHRKGYESEYFFYNDGVFSPEKNTSKFRLEYKNSPSIEFFSYSLKYFIFDLYKMLFREDVFVWRDPKYEKRLYRIFIFYLIQILYSELELIGIMELGKLKELHVQLGLYTKSFLTGTKLADSMEYAKAHKADPIETVLAELYKAIPPTINELDPSTNKQYIQFCRQLLSNVYHLGISANAEIEAFKTLIEKLGPVFTSIIAILDVKINALGGMGQNVDRLHHVNMRGGANNVNTKNNSSVDVDYHMKEYIKCKSRYLKLKNL